MVTYTCNKTAEAKKGQIIPTFTSREGGYDRDKTNSPLSLEILRLRVNFSTWSLNSHFSEAG